MTEETKAVPVTKEPEVIGIAVTLRPRREMPDGSAMSIYGVNPALKIHQRRFRYVLAIEIAGWAELYGATKDGTVLDWRHISRYLGDAAGAFRLIGYRIHEGSED